MKCVVTGVERKGTPEELVRQAIALELMQRYGYRREDMRLELPVQMGSSSDRRADIAIFRPETDRAQYTQHNAYVIVECKRADVPRSGFETAKEQLKSYMVACSNAHYGMVVAGNRRACFREIKNADGRYEIVEIDDIPHAMVPRAQFTVVGTSPIRSSQPRASPYEAQPRQAPSLSTSRSARSPGRSSFRVLGAALAVVLLGGICGAMLARRARSGATAPGHKSLVLPSVSPAADLNGTASQIPRARTAPPKLAEWAAARESRLEPAGCYRKIVREWLKINCAGRSSPRAIRDAHDMGAEGNDYFKWEKAGLTIDLVVRMVPGRKAEAVFDLAGASFVGGYDWMLPGESPVLTWISK